MQRPGEASRAGATKSSPVQSDIAIGLAKTDHQLVEMPPQSFDAVPQVAVRLMISSDEPAETLQGVRILATRLAGLNAESVSRERERLAMSVQQSIGADEPHRDGAIAADPPGRRSRPDLDDAPHDLIPLSGLHNPPPWPRKHPGSWRRMKADPQLIIISSHYGEIRAGDPGAGLEHGGAGHSPRRVPRFLDSFAPRNR